MSAWGLPAAGSAWASQVDDEEAENGGELEAPSEKEPVKPAKFTPSARAAAAAGGGGLAPPIDSASAFPSLGESLSIKETKAERKAKELKAKKKLSLAEFMAPSSGGGGSGGGYRPPGASSSSLASASTALLPTAPRARAEGEEDDRDGRGQRLGGAFKDGEHRYAAQDRSRSRERGFGDRERGERRGGFGSDDGYEEGPSRAELSSNWGGEKKFVPSTADERAGGRDGGGGRERTRSGGGGFGGGGGGGFAETYGPDRDVPSSSDRDRPPRVEQPSGLAERYGPDRALPDVSGERGGRADAVNSWGEKKAFVPSSPGDAAAAAGGADVPGGPSAADVEDRWSKKFAPAGAEGGGSSGPGSASGAAGEGGGNGGRADDAAGWRSTRSQTPVSASGDGSNAGDAAPSGSRPKLALKPRTLPAPEIVVDSSAAAAAATPSARDGDGAAGPDRNSSPSPFGAARPREGKDWRSSSEDRRRLERGDSSTSSSSARAGAGGPGRARTPRPRTEEEKELSRRVEALRKKVEAGEGDAAYVAEERRRGGRRGGGEGRGGDGSSRRGGRDGGRDGGRKKDGEEGGSGGGGEKEADAEAKVEAAAAEEPAAAADAPAAAEEKKTADAAPPANSTTVKAALEAAEKELDALSSKLDEALKLHKGPRPGW